MRFLIKAFVGMVGFLVVATGALVVTAVGVAGVVLFKQAKLADGVGKQRNTKSVPKEPVAYEPMTLEEIRAL